MREFRKTERPPWWKKVLRYLGSLFSITEYQNFGGHEDRMRSRRRKTRFDR
ncbi:MAG: hypothetical protein AAFW73_05400 [Bacteroidota bacterium]